MPNVKTGKIRDIMVIFELFKLDNRTKECYSIASSINQREKCEMGKEKGDPELKFVFSERESSFSLEIRAIRPSAVFGTRRKAALRGEGFAWVPDLGSFLKLKEVGVSPYLGFTLCLSVFMMLELFEALNGRLIGPKTWDRIIVNFEAQIMQSVTEHSWFGLLDCAFVY